MSTPANANPVRSAPPLIRHAPALAPEDPVTVRRLLPAATICVLIHLGLGAALWLLVSPNTQAGLVEDVRNGQQEAAENVVSDDQKPVLGEELPPPTVEVVAEEQLEFRLEKPEDLTLRNNRLGEATVPGDVDLEEPPGVSTGGDFPPESIGGPRGFEGGLGQMPEGKGLPTGPVGPSTGGYLTGGPQKPGSFYGRSGQTKEKLLKEGGGTPDSEAAVARGLEWLARHQAPDGHWSLNGFHRFGNKGRGCNCRDESSHQDDTAATAFGVLPFLGAGYTQKAPKDTKPDPRSYHRNVARAIAWLMRHQKPNGDFRTGSGSMYSHGLATIAICEAYGLTNDPKLKKSAQAAVNFIVRAQHPAGGWRYQPGMQGDTSVTGWQVMALKSAQMANLNVPARTMKQVEHYLDSVMDKKTNGYSYMANLRDPAATRTAVGLLCRQYLQGLGPASPVMANGVKNYLKKTPPVNGKNMYYYYYATQVLHHFGGPNWTQWNNKMRDILIKEQVRKEKDPKHPDEDGSWSPVGDPYGPIGGRVMQTSLSLLTLEVYYRYLPLYRRDVGEKKELNGK